MAVFANEGNVSQDANFRRHLDDNWDSGNREFDKIKQNVDALTRQVNDLNETIEKQDARISKLEDAVFNAVYINDTDELPTDTTSVSEDINDTHVVDDDNAVIIEESDPSLPYDIN